MRLKIMLDEDTQNPRTEFDHLGSMLCFHKRYKLGDCHSYHSSDYNGWDEMKADIVRSEDPVVILPLYLYDHGGIVMSTGKFSDPWDSGQVGFIYATREAALKMGEENSAPDRIQEILEAEVATYNQYLSGDVWGYIVEDDKGEHLDSCWGFYGRDVCEEEGKRSLEYWEEQAARREPSRVPAPVCGVP